LILRLRYQTLRSEAFPSILGFEAISARPLRLLHYSFTLSWSHTLLLLSATIAQAVIRHYWLFSFIRHDITPSLSFRVIDATLKLLLYFLRHWHYFIIFAIAFSFHYYITLILVYWIATISWYFIIFITASHTVFIRSFSFIPVSRHRSFISHYHTLRPLLHFLHTTLNTSPPFTFALVIIFSFRIVIVITLPIISHYFDRHCIVRISLASLLRSLIIFESLLITIHYSGYYFSFRCRQASVISHCINSFITDVIISHYYQSLYCIYYDIRHNRISFIISTLRHHSSFRHHFFISSFRHYQPFLQSHYRVRCRRLAQNTDVRMAIWHGHYITFEGWISQLG